MNTRMTKWKSCRDRPVLSFESGALGASTQREKVMALFGFRVRSADRDGPGDAARMQRLADTLSALVAEIERERSGLRARRDQATENAAFSMAAFEDDGAHHLSDKVDGLTSSMSRYSERISFLQAQADFVEGLLEDIALFTREYDIEIRGPVAVLHRTGSGY